jgi:predicted PurR-regulated permease PerM
VQPRGSTLYIAAEEPAIRTMLAISTAIIVAAALYFARSIFAPFAFALFIMAIVWPVQSTLQNRLPQFVALFLTLIAPVLVIVAFGTMVAWAVSVVAEWMISHAPRFQEIYLEWAHWLEEHDIRCNLDGAHAANGGRSRQQDGGFCAFGLCLHDARAA